jgi:hypothetical protein
MATGLTIWLCHDELRRKKISALFLPEKEQLLARWFPQTATVPLLFSG